MYVGITNNLTRRVYEHKNEIVPGFTQHYHIHKLVYFEEYNDVREAINREKQIKGWKRQKKNVLVETLNSTWSDLSYLLFDT